MSLAKAELRRLCKRQVTRLMLLLLVLGLGGIVTAFTVTSEKIGPAQVAAAEASAQQEYDQQVRHHREAVATCEAAKARGEDVSRNYGPDCGKEYAPVREQFQADWYLPYQFDFREQFGIFISVFAGIMALFGFLVGASYIGAEWSSGGMMNLLLWRPRRRVVLLTKLAVLLGGTLAVSAVLGALWTLAFWLIGRFDGVTGTLTSGVWQSYAISGARGIGLVLAVTAVAFGLASLGRHTAMALGAAVGLVVVVELGLRTALQTSGVRFGDRFIPTTYALAWFEKEWKLFDWRSCQFNNGECRPAEMVITWQDSALVFGAATALVLVAAFWVIRRRDIA